MNSTSVVLGENGQVIVVLGIITITSVVVGLIIKFIIRRPTNIKFLSWKTDEENNYLFYTNKIKAKPDGDTIENILKYWFGNHKKLEKSNGYMQWLFPLENQGKNADSFPLTAKEKQKMLADPEVQARLIKSFKLMLDFYGMFLRGESYVERAEHWEDAYMNLKKNSHNNRRISRILKCLTLFGCDKYCEIWLRFLSQEVYDTMELSHCRGALERYWLTSCSFEVQNKIKNLIPSTF